MVLKASSLLAVFAICLPAADQSPSFSKIYDHDISALESEFVPLVEAMPADRFGFIPIDGDFAKSRSFGQQATHVATVLYEVSAGILEEKIPVELGTNENGTVNPTSKEAVVKYVKDAFAYTHRAVDSISEDNVRVAVKSPFGDKSVTRAYLANILTWHSYDHYGQMVIYARMNKIIPPASR